MSVARTRRVLQTIAVQTADHPRTVALAAGALAVAALALAVRSGGLTGAALLLAFVAASAAVALWSRLREADRSHAALAITVADLTTRLDLLTIAAPVMPTERDPTDGTATGGTATGEIAPETAIAGADATGDASDLTATELDAAVVSPLRAPAEPKPLQRVSEQVSRRGAGGEVCSATQAPPLKPEPTSEIVEMETPTANPATVVESGPLALTSGPDNSPGAAPPPIPESMPSFTLTALNGEAVTDAVLTGTPAVVVFWRPGCQHCQRLTPELVAWESLQGPRLVVFAACDGPTAFRAGLPGLVILDPGFSVGQALGAPGTPAALPIDAAGRPSGPVVAGASAVTTLLLDAMREWASVEAESVTELPALDIESESVSLSADVSETVEGEDGAGMAPPTVLLRRVEEIPSDDAAAAPEWDAESVTRRAG